MLILTNISKYFTNNFKLNPYWVTGFSDAESSFQLIIHKNSKVKIGWNVRLSFSIHLHKKDINILYTIQNFFNGIGNITIYKDTCYYQVVSIKDLLIIVEHFNKYNLQTQKKKKEGL